ncbi:MAG: GNAT family N-acetyltransferase [Bacillota bacterium]|uniref:GNAT family N-acetyltransferase n=1 Tax=Virgibacillus salarius TaxID=447199 RepID=A0A941DVU6_9BACI|nr:MULTISPECIES: GNAT family N-acetyltransferase [Bacillaceae]NAZ10360.1 GNAT family N-acetyltransferase [Agaribacter marinus]MBR7797650.1 GNAT family N-acetyltransferase [Virgibacillus salarius]MCC2251682.1 GNAT family N-acetyltransferase [Virgibacillus sp. AGTR]MDY7045427.1 GNAT family N-acetyltransferase [Virgibacillus sp. M23]QRZ16533.1 GNAT family N-acetyltransferase [Virgibacillus sp. AGTR]
MNWYEKLNKYFPVEEMKSREHMEMLLEEKGDVYYKDESNQHVLMYAEFDTFLFIDYLWVSAKTRGQGIGHSLIEKLKAKNKPIILEVEPVDYEDSDTEKRLHFYHREGFTHAQSIGYSRRSLATNEATPMEILYWSPNDDSEDFIYEQMKKMYEDIHTYKDEEIYGQSYQPVDEVLTYDENRSSGNIMENLKTTEKA